MSKLHKFLYYLLILCVCAGVSAVPVEAGTLDGSHPLRGKNQPAGNPVGRAPEQTIPDSFELVSENDAYALYADPATLAFKVVDNRNGYIWHSNLDEKLPEDRLNRTWTAFATSGISIDFIDLDTNEKRASITSADHTIDFQETGQGFQAVLTFTEPSISMTLMVSLTENGVVVEIPFETLKEENPEFRIARLHLYPFFGANRTDSIPGYMFIPDGSGSLIRFAAQTKAKNSFYGQYYGDDLGILGWIPYDPTINRPHKISIPVIGMAHGDQENAFITIVEKGASYGEFIAHPAGIITNFNFLYNTFVYNRSYFQATNRSGAGVTVLQPSTNKFDIQIFYRFLAGKEADYVGMARSYRDHLVEQGQLSKVATPQDGEISIRLEFLAGDKERVLFWNRMIPMTTVSQMEEILHDLAIKNTEVIYYGWQPFGASRMPPRSFKMDRTLGGKDQLVSLIQEIQSNGGHLYLYLDPQAAYYAEPGYSLRSDLAMSITNINIISYNRNAANYFRNYESLSSFFQSLSKDVASQLGSGLALDGIGSNLYSDYKAENLLSREDAITRYQELLVNSGSSAFYKPNHYLFRTMQAYFDIPVTDSGYIYTTDTVPFLQIVFAGYVPVFGPALNFSSNLQEDLLRHADFGVYPSFFLTHEPTAKILETFSNWIYTSAYAQWGGEIQRTYQWLNQLLGPVKGQEIVAREELSDGVFATTYSNGKMIIVNYSDRPFTTGELTVNGRDALLSEVQP